MVRIAVSLLAGGISIAAHGQPATPAPETREAFLAGIANAVAESDLALGAGSDAVRAALTRYFSGSRFVAEYERDVAARFGGACAALRLREGLDALLEQNDPAATPASRKRLPQYLGMLEGACPRRMQEERVLLGAILSAVEKAQPLRAQRHARFLAEERERLAREVEEERAGRERLAIAAAKEVEERERRIAAEAAEKAAEEKRAAVEPQSAVAGLAGTYECGEGDEARILLLGEAGEAVDLVVFGGHSLGYGGLYRTQGDRVIIRFMADNMWKMFAMKYEQPIADEFAWKRSAIASQKVMEFVMVPAGGKAIRLESQRVKTLRSGAVADLKRPACKRLESSSATVRGVAAHARFAMRHMDKEKDEVPISLAGASLALGPEIERKKRKELEWFRRAPGVIKMMVTDRLLEELRKSADGECLPAKALFERGASEAMSSINKISDSEFARSNPQRAAEVAGHQLDSPFEEFLELAGKSECVMDEASAVGL